MAMAAPPPVRARPPEASLARDTSRVNIEDQVRSHYFAPSPQAYNPRKPERTATLGKISKSKVPSALDAPVKLKDFVPGPGSYNTPDLREFALPDGGRLNRAPPVQRLKLQDDDNPPPGRYGIPNDPTCPRAVFGKFGRDPKVTKFIRDEQLRSRHIPGPGAHDVMEALESAKPFCPEGGRCMAGHKPESYFDRVTKIAESKPGPDAYDLPCAIQPHKSIGKCVWRYHSETLKDSRRAVAHAVGDRNEVPGPGTYTIPDPAPISGVPTLKSRNIPAMPGPFAYNCQPDHSNKFDSLAPVRQKNSGDQIYGRDLKKGTAGTKVGKRASSAAPADQVEPAYLPVPLMTQEEQPAVAVQWRSGGFTDLRKSKSAGAIAPAPEHPAFKETAKMYPQLAKKKSTSSVFLSTVSRRSESVKRRSAEIQHIQRKKWELEALTNEISTVAAVTIEPLDEDKLRQQAMDGLIMKAKERMRLEGVALDQQELVLAELPHVLQESTNSVSPSHAPSEDPASVREALDEEAEAQDWEEPSEEPPPREVDTEEELPADGADVADSALGLSADVAERFEGE